MEPTKAQAASCAEAERHFDPKAASCKNKYPGSVGWSRCSPLDLMVTLELRQHMEEKVQKFASQPTVNSCQGCGKIIIITHTVNVLQGYSSADVQRNSDPQNSTELYKRDDGNFSCKAFVSPQLIMYMRA